MLTIEQIKDALPNVPVCKRGATVESWSLYRPLEAQATIVDPEDDSRTAKVPWSTIQRVLNTPGGAVIL